MMVEFDDVTIRNNYENLSAEKEIILNDLMEIIVNSNSILEGNYFYYHTSLIPNPECYNKQLNLFWCGKTAETKICEIGFNAGHSSMLMLLGRNQTPLEFTIFDIGHHAYTKPCFTYMKSKFQHVTFDFIEGDSTVTMPIWMEANQDCKETYDVVHVDGGHTEHCISNDMIHADWLVKKGGIIIIDDTIVPYINKYVDIYVMSGKYREIDVLKIHPEFSHRVIRKLL